MNALCDQKYIEDDSHEILVDIIKGHSHLNILNAYMSIY